MYEIKPESFSTDIVFQLKGKREIVEYRVILAHFLETIAIKCEKAGTCLIGHIKGLVLGKGESYFKISVISASLPANIEGNLNKEADMITLNLNVIIYGLSSDTLEKIVREAASVFKKEYFDSITVNHTIE